MVMILTLSFFNVLAFTEFASIWECKGNQKRLEKVRGFKSSEVGWQSEPNHLTIVQLLFLFPGLGIKLASTSLGHRRSVSKGGEEKAAAPPFLLLPPSKKYPDTEQSRGELLQ
jgi:hypothetical protein